MFWTHGLESREWYDLTGQVKKEQVKKIKKEYYLPRDLIELRTKKSLKEKKILKNVV